MSTRQEEKRLGRKDQQEEGRLAERKEKEAGLLEAVVRDKVMSELGSPTDLHRVQVRSLWANHFRLNVFIGPDAVSSRVAHSYFLEADGDGKILSSCPAITRAY